MKLTVEEKRLLNGERGDAARLAMEIIVRLGGLYGAKELIPISQAHIDGCLYAAVGEAGLEFAEKLYGLGAQVVVPTSLNATSRDIVEWSNHKVGLDYSEKNSRMEQAYVGMGAVPTWTCAPYQAGLVPRFGQQIAWAESNAIVYANSVIGARTERYGDYTDICCAIVGRVPKFGLHLKENRRGRIHISCEGLSLVTTADFAVLGYIVGELAKDLIPVLTGIPGWTTSDHLKAFGAAAASSGSVAMFHMVGVTPEAPDFKTAFQGVKPEEEIVISDLMLKSKRNSLSSAGVTAVDIITVGCPHLSAAELMKIASLLNGRKISKNIELWLNTNNTAYNWLENTNVISDLKKSGAKIFRDTCFVNTDLSGWGFKTVMTNSGKYAHYVPSRNGMKVIFTDVEKCIETAVSGRIGN